MAQALFKHWFVDFGPFRDGEFVESEMGLIPEGWRPGVVEDLMELAYGKGLPEKSRVPGQYSVFGSSGRVGTHNSFLVEGPGVIVGRKGTIGSLSWSLDNFWPIDTTYYVVPKHAGCSLEYLYYVLKDLDLDHRNNDSAVPGLNRSSTYKLPVVVPPGQVLNAFSRIVKPWFRMVANVSRVIESTAATRDYLLPRLLSGEVSVTATEETVAEVV